jgi:tellurite resistance protein TehA-like permease
MEQREDPAVPRRPEKVRSRLARWAGSLPPSCFALVMATAITSHGLESNGWGWAATALLWFGLAAFAVFLVVLVRRLFLRCGDVIEDARNPARAFGFFTFAAAADVLSSQLASEGHAVPAVALLVVGAAAWIFLGYFLPLALITRHGAQPALAAADGSWFLWVVAVQSTVVALTGLSPSRAPALGPLAVFGWSIGVVLYLVVSVLVVVRLFMYRVEANSLTPSYWIFMGATATTAFAGCRVLRWAGDPFVAAAAPTVMGMSAMFWAFGSWLIPVLVLQSVWWERTRVPLIYGQELWSIVFPIVMHAVATRELGSAFHASWLRAAGSTETWAGALIWLIVLLAMVATTARRALGRESP